MKKILILLLSVTLGCATMHRHPNLVKAGALTGGALVGLSIGLVQKPHPCASMYDGKPYNGTPPCPK